MPAPLRHRTMSEETQLSDTEDLQERLAEVQTLLARHRLVEDLVHRQDTLRHDLVEDLCTNSISANSRKSWSRCTRPTSPTSSRPCPDERLIAWELVKAEREGEILLEVSDAVRESLIESMGRNELVAAAETSTPTNSPTSPRICRRRSSPTSSSRCRWRSASNCAPPCPTPRIRWGDHADFDMVTVREDVTLEVVLRYLRRFDELPDHTDQLFVVDRDEHLKGVLPSTSSWSTKWTWKSAPSCRPTTSNLNPTISRKKRQGLRALRSGLGAGGRPRPQADRPRHGQYRGDFIREEAETEQLAKAGLRRGRHFRLGLGFGENRWSWLAINLVTAFVASRAIGAFEGSIEKLVALAALMPIVAGIGGNPGNQTITMIVRAVAMGQVQPDATRRLLRKELGVSPSTG